MGQLQLNIEIYEKLTVSTVLKDECQSPRMRK